MRVLARRSQAYASNSHIFLVWMGASSIVLLGVAILFLRNQIRPILRLAEAAESFGKGREIEFRPRGAREVRQAGHAFLEMKRRIERAIEQRTTMLNGVSHDLRTILTRFKLSLVLLRQTPEVEDLKRDVDEMTRMLEGYLAFARGDAGEQAVTTDLRTLLEELQVDAERQGHVTDLDIVGDPMITVRPDAFRRLLFNLVSNAARHGDRIAIHANHETRWLVVHVDDDGPGIPADCARRCSSRSCASTRPATRTRAAPASASRSPATSRARMAATSRSTTARWAACGRRCGCRPDQ